MTENIFERLARKIELAKARGDREAAEGLKPGFGRNATGGLTYEPPAGQLEAKASPPAEPPGEAGCVQASVSTHAAAGKIYGKEFTDTAQLMPEEELRVGTKAMLKESRYWTGRVGTIVEVGPEWVRLIVPGTDYAAQPAGFKREHCYRVPQAAPSAGPVDGASCRGQREAPLGIWRKTSEHKPPVGSEQLTRYTGRGCGKSPDVRPLVWNGEVWREGDANIGSCALRDWLDTSGEFKVGDRVRVKEWVVSRFCKPGMFGVVTDSTINVWFLADGENRPFCATGWLEHAPDAPQSN